MHIYVCPKCGSKDTYSSVSCGVRDGDRICLKCKYTTAEISFKKKKEELNEE